MKESHKSTKLIYLIYDNDRCEIVVNYKTPAYNTSKAIFSTLNHANKCVKTLNQEQGFDRFDIIQYRR